MFYQNLDSHLIVAISAYFTMDYMATILHLSLADPLSHCYTAAVH